MVPSVATVLTKLFTGKSKQFKGQSSRNTGVEKKLNSSLNITYILQLHVYLQQYFLYKTTKYVL